MNKNIKILLLKTFFFLNLGLVEVLIKIIKVKINYLGK